MDIPLPGEDVPEEIKPPDIPMPEDSNRYSPSVPIEDDPPPAIVPPPPPPPLPPPDPAPQSATTNSAKSLVLGKTQAKKRLLAFSMTKQGGGVGLSFSLNKKQAPLNKEAVKVFTGDEKAEEGKKKNKKGTREDKARDTISEIEELKRKEMLMRENMQLFHPRWGNRENHLYPSLTLPIPLSVDDLPTKRTVEIESIVGELFANKLKAKEEERKHSDSRERRRKSSKRSPDKDRERSSRRRKVKTLPHDWAEFKKEGHRIHNFRRFKYEVEKEELREKRRHRRGSRDRRSRSRERRDKTSKSNSEKVNFLETPMAIKKVLHVLEARGGGDLEFPEYLVRYTNAKPKLTYCENPKIATYHLQSRKQMLATVPRDIEEIIFKFLGSIHPKRLRTTKVTVTPNDVKIKKEDLSDRVQSDLSDVEKDYINSSNKDLINSESNETTDDKVKVCNKKEVSDTEKIDDSDEKQEEMSCHKCHREWFPIYKNSLVLSEVVVNEDEDVEVEDFSVAMADNNNENISKGGENTTNNIDRLSENKNADKKLNEELEPIIRTAIRSKWDSDYEESPHASDAEKTSVKKTEDLENLNATAEEQVDPNDIQGVDSEMCQVDTAEEDNLGVVPMELVDNEKVEEEGDMEEFTEENAWSTVVKHQRQEGEGGDPVEKLASEYEEFMKMVASENKDDLSDEQGKRLMSVNEMIQENSFSNNDSKVKEDSEDYGDKVDSRTQSPFYENQEEQNDTRNDNDIWSGKFGYTNRSRSQSSASSEYVGEDDKLQVALRKKIIAKAMKKKKDKKKVHGSKIKKRSKNKKQKINKKKKKKQSSSESSSSSSSSSSSQSSSSSSSSSSDESSSSESSSNTSETSSSSSSSDSSVDKKKIRKKKKLKKLKQKLKLKKKKKPTSESSSSSDDEDEETTKSEKNKRRKKKKSINKKLKRKATDEEDTKIKKNKISKRNKDKKIRGKEHMDSNDEEENAKMKRDKHDKKKKKSSGSKKRKYESSDEEKTKKQKKSKNKENSDKKQGKRKSKEFASDNEESYMRLKDIGFIENVDNKENERSFKVKTAVLSEIQSKEGKFDKKAENSAKGKRKIKEFEDESDNSDNAERDYLPKKAKHIDSDSVSSRLKKGKGKDHIEMESEEAVIKEKTDIKKMVYDDFDFNVDNENSRRSSHSMKQWDDEDNSNSEKVKSRMPVSVEENENKSEKWEIENSVSKDHETFSQRQMYNRMLDKTTSHDWESEEESDENYRHNRSTENDVGDNSDENGELIKMNIKKLHDELLKTKKKSKKDSKKKKSRQHEHKDSSDEEKRSKKKKKKSKKSSKSDEEASVKTNYLNIFFQNEERSKLQHDQKYYQQHKTDFDFSTYSSGVHKESEDSVNSGVHNKSNDSDKHCPGESKNDSFDESSRDEVSKDEHSFNDSFKSRSLYEWSDDSQTVASFAKHKDEEKLNEESISKDDWTKENSSQYLSEQSNSINSKALSVGDYLKTSEEKKQSTFEKESKIDNKTVEKNTFEQTESIQKGTELSEGDAFSFLKSYKKDRKHEHSEDSSDNSDFVKTHSTESSIDGLDFDSQQDSFELEKDTTVTKTVENADISKRGRAFSEISLSANDNQAIHSNSSSKLTNDSERYSPTLDLDAGSPNSINKYDSDMSLDSNEPENSSNFVNANTNQDVNMLDIPLPPPTTTVLQTMKSLCVPPPPPPASVSAAISSSASTPAPVPAPVPAPAPVPPPAFQPKVTSSSSSFKNVLNIPSFPPLPSDSESKHVEQIESHSIQLEQEPLKQVELKMAHCDSKSESECLPSQGIHMPLKNTKITFHKPLLRTKAPNIFDNSDDEDENLTKKKTPKIDFDNDSEKETEEKMDGKQKKKSRWGMEPDDELPIVKLYLANEEVQKAPAQIESKDESTEFYERKNFTEDNDLLTSVNNKSKIIEDTNEKSCDELYKDIIEPTDIVDPENLDTDDSKKELLQEVWFDQSSSNSMSKTTLVKEVDDSSELSENKSLSKDSDRHESIYESHSDLFSNVSADVNTVADEIQASAINIKVEVESDEHTYNENLNYSNASFQIKEEIDKKPDELEITTRSERSRSRSYSRDERKKSRDYSPDRSYSSRRRVSPRDRRYTRDRRRDLDRRRDRSRSRERRRDHSRERRRRDSPDRRDRRKDRYRRQSSPRERKRERRDSPHPRRDSPPHRDSPPRRDSPQSRRDSSSPRRDSSPPRRDSPLPRRDSTPRRDSPPPRRESPLLRRDSPPLQRREAPQMQRRDSPSWGRNSREKSVLNSLAKQSDVYQQMDFQEYRHEEKIPGYQLQVQSDVDHAPQGGHHSKESDVKTSSIVGCKRSIADSTISDSELITPKKIIMHSELSPKRLSLDARIELELGVKKSPPPPPPPAAPAVNQYPAYYQIPVHDGSQMIPVVTQVPPQRRPPSTLVQPPQMEWNAEAFIGTTAQQHSQPQPKAVPGNSQVLQVGNILQVVPTEMTPPSPLLPPKPITPPVLKQIITTGDSVQPQTKVVQIGNMLQVVPSTVIIPPTVAAASTPSPVPTPTPPPAPPTPPKPSPLSLPLPVIKKELPLPPLPEVSDKAELRRLEKERRRKEKELKRQEKFKKATKKIIKKLLYKEGLTSNTDVENEEMQLIEEAMNKSDELDTSEIPVQPRTKPVTPLPPPPDKGILVSPGFREKPILTEKLPTNKVVSFADGIRPGEGTSPSAGEDHPMSPPPACTLPKEKRFKKKKKKRKVKVRIIRVEEGDDDDDDDDEDISPPPPPPGSPPPMFHYPPPPPGFMYHPPSFSVLQGSGEGQMFAPVYQQHHSSTTTTHTTTVQFAPPPPPPPQKLARK